jgi:preprotein translocase subunit SecA
MDAASLEGQIASLREGCFTDLTRQYVPVESVEEQWDVAGLEKVLREEWQLELALRQELETATAITDGDVVEKVVAAANGAFAEKLQKIGEENFTQFERVVLLQSIDSHWREHLSALDYLRQGIHLRGYAQKQPKQEYKREAFELFGQLLDSVKNDVTKVLMTVNVQPGAPLDQVAEELESRAENFANITYTAPTETGDVEVRVDEALQRRVQAMPGGVVPRVGRNEPCPCGSGNKYKNCHGRLN